VRCGFHLPQFRKPVTADEIRRVANAAEAAGLDDLWVSDHLALAPHSTRPPSSFHDSLTVLTWAAASTRTIGLGTSVLVMPYRNPVILAKTVATIDALSGGRVILGVASGWLKAEFDALGVAYAGRGAATDAALRVCRELWNGGTVSGAAIDPPPATAGGPPFWVGGNSDAGIRRAARFGQAWHTTISDPPALADRLTRLDRELHSVGRGRESIVVSVRIRATSAELEPQIAHYRALGVGHVLVDHPDIVPSSLGDELARLREMTS
jgi:probable F420-dependent oxidoreductase